MYCQFCGKQIPEFADVCIGCGKLLNQNKKIKVKDGVFKPLSILILVFSSIFFVIGAISLFVSLDYYFFSIYYSNSFFLNMQKDYPNYYGSYWAEINTEFFVSFIVSLIFESCSAVLSLILLIFNSKKVLNIVSLGISMGLLALVGIIVFCAGI